MAFEGETKKEIVDFPFDVARFYPPWLLKYTDDLIGSNEPDVQDEGYELLDLYDEFGDEVLELVQPKTPRQIILVDPNQLVLGCFLSAAVQPVN